MSNNNNNKKIQEVLHKCDNVIFPLAILLILGTSASILYSVINSLVCTVI